MITADEVHVVNNEIRSSVLAGSYASALDKLHGVYELHIKDKSEHVQTNAIEQFISHLRGIYGVSGKIAAIAGITFAEGLNIRLDDKHLRTLLKLGRAIFSGIGDSQLLLQIMHEEFSGIAAKNSNSTNYNFKPS